MHEFETFAYLDVQKTASTFISRLLKKYCTETEIRYRKHAPIGKSYDRAKFYFISVRDPVDQYISLYSYGCKRAGLLQKTLRAKGYARFYDSTWKGFQEWLAFVLDPKNAAVLNTAYGHYGHGRASRLVGFQSFRFLRLAVPNPANILMECKTAASMKRAYEDNKIANFVIRYESLRSDLSELVTTKLGHAISKPHKALAYVEQSHARNTSNRIDKKEADPTLSEECKKAVHEREWLLHEIFNY